MAAPMNGSKGRVRTLARIKRGLRAEARVDGVDPNDRAAFRAWRIKTSEEFYARLRREIAERVHR